MVIYDRWSWRRRYKCILFIRWPHRPRSEKNHAVWILLLQCHRLLLLLLLLFNKYFCYIRCLSAWLASVNITITSIILLLCYITVVTCIFSVLTQQATNLHSPIFVKSSSWWLHNITMGSEYWWWMRVACVCGVCSICTQSGVTYRTLQRFTKRISLSIYICACVCVWYCYNIRGL